MMCIGDFIFIYIILGAVYLKLTVSFAALF